MKMLYPFQISCLINAISTFSIGSFVFWRNRRNVINLTFFLLNLVTAIWSVGMFIEITSTTKEGAFWTAKIFYFAVFFIPVFYSHFILSLFNLYSQYKKFIYLGYGLGILLSILNFANLVIIDVHPIPDLFINYFAKPGPFYHFFLFIFGIYAFIPNLAIFKHYRALKPYSQNQYKYIFAASLLAFMGGSTSYLPVFNIKFYPYPNFLVSLYPLIIAYAIIKHRLMDIKVAITRAGIFAFVYSLVLGIPFIIGYLTKSWILPTAIMFFLATLGPLIYTHLRKKAEDLILAEQKKYQRILLQAAQGMVKVKDLKHLINLMVHIVTKAVRVDKAAVFRLDKEKNLYQLEAYRDREQFKKEEPLSPDHSLIKHLLATKEPLLLEEIPFIVKGRLSQEEISSFFKEHNFCLVVPSFTETTLLGFLALGSKPNNQVFTPDDINVFKILAQQASLAIENCQFIEEFQKTQEKIFRADKLATVGAMAEGVSHQMNNRLQVFAAIAGDLKDLVASTLKNNPNLEGKLKEDLQYCLKSLEKMEKNVTHSAQVIRGILNYARTEKDSSFRFLDIKEVIDIAVDLLGVKHNLKGFKLQIKASLNLPKVYGSNAQLSEAIFNLIDNAYEAIEDKETYYEVKDIPDQIEKQIIIEIEPLKNSLLIKIKDTGIGIKEENKPKIFVPFYTTKSSAKSGTGLGMYVVKRIIEENHKGKIWFESKYLQGTTFYVELPCRRV
ncbi:MAG: hypothetical protein DRP69_02310 [Candidatus Duberdicusella sinuisediminis]|nr:MAG: hypothetical protein DRP69_02310 [Candidatus Omnitrophota bacterium]